MSKLLIYIDENQKFDFPSIADTISSIDGVSNPRQGKFIGAVYECNYSHANRTTVIRISEDLETITAEGLGEEVMDFAVKLQKSIPFPLNAIDIDYSFNVNLSNFQSKEALISALRQN